MIRTGSIVCGMLALVVLLSAGTVLGDTTDVKTLSTVVIEKSGAHCQDDPNCFNRYHPAIKPAARAKPGQQIVFATRDALDTDLNFESHRR